MSSRARGPGATQPPDVPRVRSRGRTARPKLSVVVPCLDDAETVGALEDSLARQEWSEPWEVVVADNGSTDGSMEVVARYRDRLPELRIVDASDRRGVSHARNLGVRAARGEAVAFIDADDVAAPGWVAAMGDALAEHDFVASRYDNETLNDPLVVQARGGRAQTEGLQRLWYPPYLEVCGGSGMGVKRDLLLRVGGFREDVLSAEDNELSLRLQYEGATPVFVPGALVLMRFRTSARSLFTQAMLWAEWNVLLYRLHCPRGWAIENPWRRVFERYGWIARRLLRRSLRDRGARYKLVWQLGWQIGLLRGSLKHRVPPPAWIPEDERPDPPDDPTEITEALPTSRRPDGALRAGGGNVRTSE